MGTTLEEIRSRLQSMNRRTDKPKDIFKPKDEHDVRLLPYPLNPDDPLVELTFHYEIDGNSVLCPKANFGEDCAICDACDVLKAWKDEDGREKPEAKRKEDFEIFKKIQPKGRVFVPVVERGQEANGAKFWGLSPTQALQLLEICTDGDRLEACGLDRDEKKKGIQVLINPDKAFDLHVSFAKPGEKGNTKTFGVATISGKIAATPLVKEKKAREDLLKSVKNIKDVYVPVSSAEVEKIWSKFVGAGMPEAKAEGGKEYNAPKSEAKANTAEDAKKVGKRSVDEAFADMVDN